MNAGNSSSRQGLALVGWLALVFAAGLIGAAASRNSAGFYYQLERPAWAPPSEVFGPVWTVLYIMMGIAAWLVWNRGGFRAQGRALGLFLVQLAANALWTWLFFAWHLGLWASVEIALLWVLILFTIIAFWRIRPVAGLLLLPYLAWVTYATVLCFAVWRLNPEQL